MDRLIPVSSIPMKVRFNWAKAREIQQERVDSYLRKPQNRKRADQEIQKVIESRKGLEYLYLQKYPDAYDPKPKVVKKKFVSKLAN